MTEYLIRLVAAGDEAVAQAIVDDDPAVANRPMMRATLFPYRVAVTGRGR